MDSEEYTDPKINPLQQEDVDKILHDEISYDKKEGWKQVKKGEDVEIWEQHEKGHSIHLIKGVMNFKEIAPKTVLDLVQDVENRPKWDRLFTEIEVLESYETHRVVYWRIKTPHGISDRDLIQKICLHHDESTDTRIVFMYNASHPSKPPVHGVVRAKTIKSAVIIRPHPDQPNSTKMTMFFQTDMKGHIPDFLTNIVAAKAPTNWYENFTSYYKSVGSQQA